LRFSRSQWNALATMSRSRTLLAMSMSSVYQPNGHDLTTDCIRFARRKQQRRDLRAEIMLAAANRSPFPTATVLVYLPQRSPKMQPVAHDESLRAAMNKAKMRGGVSSIATTPQKFLNSGLRLRVLGHGMPFAREHYGLRPTDCSADVAAFAGAVFVI
jgi:hypothetical protein